MTTNQPIVSVIVINYNSAEYTIKCIDSIVDKTNKGFSFEIIIVDNASVYEDYILIKNYVEPLSRPNISIHRSLINTGFGGGNMIGVGRAKGDYLLFLNNDAILLNDAIEACYEFMLKTPEAGVCGGNIFNDAGGREISFDYFTSCAREIFGKKFVQYVYQKPDRKKEYLSPITVDYVNGSFMFFDTKSFHNVGGFDDKIFLYFEESDICYRLKQQGKKTYFLPDAHYLHYHGKSTEKALTPIEFKIELKTSMFYVIRKNLGDIQYHILRAAFIIRYGFSSVFKRKNRQLFMAILEGLPMRNSLKHAQKKIPK